MVRTMSVFISFFLLISMLNVGWSSRLCPCVPNSFRTFSSSPCNGRIFISAKPCLMVKQNVNNVPVIQAPEKNFTQQQDNNDLITKKTVEIQEQDIKIAVEESSTVIKTVLSDGNGTKIEEDIVTQDNLEYTENIEERDIEFKNMPTIVDLPVDSDTSSLDSDLSSVD